MSSQNCQEVDAHCDTPSICTALYHCLLKELPHIYTASSLLLMQQLKDKSASSLFLFELFFLTFIVFLVVLVAALCLCFKYRSSIVSASWEWESDLQFLYVAVKQRFHCCLRKPVCICHATQSHRNTLSCH